MRESFFSRNYPVIIVGILFFTGLYLTSLYNYLLFHSIAEFTGVIVACGVFMLAWNSRRFLDNNYLLFIGVAYLFVASLDLVHTLAYKGMNIFRGYDANLPTQLWIAARYMESLSLLIAPWFIRRTLNGRYALVGCSVFVTLLLAAIFYGNTFPDCYIEGIGLTTFKVASEYVICLILLAAMFLLLRNRKAFDSDVLRLLVWSIIVTIVAELAFTFYVGVYDLSNLVGHFFKVVSFYLIYKAIIETGLVKPYAFLFRNLKETNERLELEVTRRSLAEESLKSKNRELEKFSYVVSHDLKAPLRGIDGYSKLLLERHKDRLDSEGQRFLSAVRSAVSQMNELIEGLLAYSRMERHNINAQDINPSDLVRDIIAGRMVDIKERHIDVRVEIPFKVLSFDPEDLRQALSQLLDNAIKFTRTVSAPHIKINGQETEKSYILSMRDNGIGFDMKYHDRLFEMLWRLNPVEEYHGAGIGLATVRRIMDRTGGRVWAQSKPGEGATFYLEIPRRQT